MNTIPWWVWAIFAGIAGTIFVGVRWYANRGSSSGGEEASHGSGGGSGAPFNKK